MNCEIRNAQPADAGDISRVIIAALRQTNGQDYPQDIIQRIEKSFSPDGISRLMSERKVFVAVIGGDVVGTASLDGQVVRSVFVAPGKQKQGIGKRLMDAVERAARDAGMQILSVPSSITAEAFYARLGFIPISERYHGDERTMIMERELG
ncbi:GNAT family N-acetyltransferase [Hydrocarboniclastica marina]|uniref:GNAT family N-acetyltransferase n=1 Tax=Hydrocarboniclastica marina TaxID=2259620 RepID=A0A4P7XJ82_9ALTE|nr:GNAT family N-acetyltransferase [Hydrocarboniclastica marina]QCF27156.1 GNAT family N-acetyltransferase [Hydrocarboniclastica marina]